jgi:hypothetical protein
LSKSKFGTSKAKGKKQKNKEEKMNNSHRFLGAKAFLGGVAKGGFVGGAIGTTITVFAIINHINNEELHLAYRLQGIDERAHAARQDTALLAKELGELRKVVDEGRKN